MLVLFHFRKRLGARQNLRLGNWNRSWKGLPMIHSVLIADTEHSLDDANVADFLPQSTPPLLSPIQGPSLPQRPSQPAPSACHAAGEDGNLCSHILQNKPTRARRPLLWRRAVGGLPRGRLPWTNSTTFTMDKQHNL